MRVLMLSTRDKSGGAAISAYRLHQAQQKAGIDSVMLVREKSTRDPSVHSAPDNSSFLARNSYKLSHMLEYRPLKNYTERSVESWHTARIPNKIIQQIRAFSADVVYLHWIWAGYIPISTLPSIQKPLIWKIPDSSPFTGGCHVAYSCTRFQDQCGRCPLLKSNDESDLSRKTWKRKQRHWQNLDMTIVAASRWLADRSKSSSLFQNYPAVVIPNGLDLTVFRPIEKKQARTLLNLPHDKKLILFGAINSLSTKNKGFHLLKSALQALSSNKAYDEVEVVIFGAYPPQNSPEIPFKVHYPGILRDELSLALIYSAADIMIVPSIQEAFGQTASESLACGTPVIAFGATGLLDIVDHQHNGYLATPYEPGDLAQGIMWILEDEKRYNQLCENARETALQKFNIHAVARQYIDLYETILNRTSEDS